MRQLFTTSKFDILIQVFYFNRDSPIPHLLSLEYSEYYFSYTFYEVRKSYLKQHEGE